MNKFSFRKYGNGSSVYEVFLLVEYIAFAKVAKYTTLGFVEKINGEWITTSYGGLTAKSRKELVDKMEKHYKEGIRK